MVTTSKASLAQIFQAGAIAGGIAAVVNAVIFFIASSAGQFPSTVITPMGQPISVIAVVISSLIGALGGAVGYAVVQRFARDPNRMFLIVAAVVFVLSFFNPFSLQGAPVGMIVSLELMHVVVAGLVVYFLTRFNR